MGNTTDLPFEVLAKMARDAGLTVAPFQEGDEWHRVTNQGATADVWMTLGEVFVFDIHTAEDRLRQGDARTLLQRLKTAFGRLVTASVLADRPESLAFWQQMLDEGIADEAETIELRKLVRKRV